jgi:short-subunit dehydrogenase
MELRDRTVLLTGASSGIGRCLASELAREGARLALVGRRGDALHETRRAVGSAETFPHDLSEPGKIPELWDEVRVRMGLPDVLINNAGVLDFAPVEQAPPERVGELLDVNVLAPLLLCREAARDFRARGSGQIVNVGSIFGSIGFAYFSSYSATKFALRGFSQALRRELAGSGVHVTYVAPRATRTRLADLFGEYAAASGMRVDAPEWVAQQIARAVRSNARDRYLGFPESLFVRVNALWPRLVDAALRRQDRLARRFAEAAVESVEV